ncbi:MAG: DUF5131 family protein, partial [bacterium]
VFCASLADVFDNEAPQAWRDDLWELICDTPRLEWLLVTKRIGNVEKMGGAMLLKTTPNTRLIITVCNQEEADRDIPKLLALPCKNGISYEPALGPIEWNTWPNRQWLRVVGADGAAVRGKIGWIIVGGESGSKARPFNIDWARSTIAQCKAAGVPVFCKQFGANPIVYRGEADRIIASCGRVEWDDSGEQISARLILRDRAGADPAEWPDDLRVREFPQ